MASSVSRESLLVWSVLTGLLLHAGWFIKGEHDMRSRQYAAIWIASQPILLFLLVRAGGQGLLEACANTFIVSVAFTVSLFSSIAVYRLFFHRLQKFPGPFSWKVSKFVHVFKNLDSFGYKHLDGLHRQYGKFVRTGPSELSIADPRAVPLVLGPNSKCTKAVWYDTSKPMLSLHNCRDRKIHSMRRKIWDKGFNATALRDYEARVVKYTDLLMEKLVASPGKPLNAAKWFNYYSFDVMGDLAFGKPFYMLEKDEKHYAIELLDRGIAMMNIVPYAPWLFWLLGAIPPLVSDITKFVKWGNEQAERRKHMKVTEPDLMTHLLDGEPMSTDEAVNQNWQTGDARLIIVAGSDTTATTLTHATYELLKNPEALRTLRREVDGLVSAADIDYAALSKCEFLNGVIDETLRLHPPVPSGLIRITPPEGLTVGETYIPGDTNMILPLFTIQRSPDAFVKPNEFLPERWTEKPELVKDKGAFAPFSLGPMGCVGKNLAYMELRAVLSRLVTQFDIAFAEGEDGSTLIDKTEDHFTLTLANMYITCKPRAS